MKQSILAVDDELHMLKLLERIITEKTGYHIETTNNALEVEKILHEKHFDLIITDLKMPVMDGLDILRLVREAGRSEEVIIITAFGSLESASEALSAGVFDYITKPFRKEQIITTVDRAMRWQKARKELEALSGVFAREPYKDALSAFLIEYVLRLADRCAGDGKLMARRSGLSPDVIGRALADNGKRVS
ncbi:MAG: response regulator [Pseudomonadota bacterium]